MMFLGLWDLFVGTKIDEEQDKYIRHIEEGTRLVHEEVAKEDKFCLQTLLSFT